MASTKKLAKKRVPSGVKRRSVTKVDTLDVFIAAAAKTFGLPVQKAWLPTIKANLQVTLLHAQSVDEFKLPDGAEPAPVFKA